MLVQLHIENYALIDRVVVEFGPGLNILTGETGAGKSMIMGALGLVLGQRASTDVIRTSGKPTRVGFKVLKGGRKVRVARRSGETID